MVKSELAHSTTLELGMVTQFLGIESTGRWWSTWTTYGANIVVDSAFNLQDNKQYLVVRSSKRDPGMQVDGTRGVPPLNEAAARAASSILIN